jgi:hypothetical protein
MALFNTRTCTQERLSAVQRNNERVYWSTHMRPSWRLLSGLDRLNPKYVPDIQARILYFFFGSKFPARVQPRNDRFQYFLSVQPLTLKGNCGSFFLVQWLLILAITKRAFPGQSCRSQTQKSPLMRGSRSGTIGQLLPYTGD